MAKPEFFQEAFDQLAKDGCIGDPNGELAYAYLRVSSAGQAEEGRSGLPRQILHCHEVALQRSLKVPWELVFADDHSGFEFRDRPELTRLREEYKLVTRRANAIVMENLDRLSRNADWHQGFLLDEMKQYHLRVAFWKDFSSRIERAVIGAISQEGMEQAKQRMAEGNIYKAKDNRVTARVAAFGYCIVDRHGQASTDARKDTHYAIIELEAGAVRTIFRKVGIEGWALRRLAKWMDDYHKPPKRCRRWDPKVLSVIIRNPVYKGEFAAHRYAYVKVPAANQKPNQPMHMAWKKIERPRSEWITVKVPAIVSSDLWELANQMLKKNAQTGRRHAKEPYLLTGMVKCAACGYAYIGRRCIKRQNGKEYLSHYYQDSSAKTLMGIFRDIHCTQSQIAAPRLEGAVWRVISRVLLEPELVIQSMDDQFTSGPNAQLRAEVEYLRQQVSDLDTEDEDLYRAYRARAFDAEEYAARREAIKERRRKLQTDIIALEGRVLTREKLEINKQRVLEVSAALKKHGLTPNPPFETKQTILKLVVDKISLNVDEGWFELEGIIPGRFPIDESIACIPEDTDSSRRVARSSPERSTSLAPAQSKPLVLPPMAVSRPRGSARRTRVTHPRTARRDGRAKFPRGGANVRRQPGPHVKSYGAVHETADSETAAYRSAACLRPNRCGLHPAPQRASGGAGWTEKRGPTRSYRPQAARS
jgi:site-specific DNA recombinase